MELPMPDDEIPNLKSAVKGFIQWPIATTARFTGMSKTSVSGFPTKRVMPQHENAPSTKKGKGKETPKEPNKQDKALEETTKHQKMMQKIDEVKERVEKEKAANRKYLQALEDEVLLNRPQSVIDGYNKWMSRGDYAEPYAISVNKKVFRHADESYFAINATDIMELLTYQELECGIVTLFEISLYHLKGHSSQNKLPKETIAAESNSSRIRFSMHYQVVLGCSVPWSNERPLENKELNAIIGAWFTLWRD
ncbi:hypothetical protein Tco_0831735 [Tanacetum coccineum]